jgi:glycosyltransferase involved in cell wall biosynthesis
MKITIISNYLFPETGAASNRITKLAEGLACKHDVEVVAPLPNYPTGKIFNAYKGRFFLKEKLKGYDARRYWSYNSNSSNPLKRGVAMFSFGITLFLEGYRFFRRQPDIVIIQNSPLLVSFFGIIVTKTFSNAKIILNVSDLWPLSALELGVLKRGRFYSLLEQIEKFNYKFSDSFLGQSQEILDHINSFQPSKPKFLYRNVPEVNDSREDVDKQEPTRIVYAGLLGVAQGVLEICKNIDFAACNSTFDIYGAGNELEEIVSLNKSGVNYKGSLPVDEIRKVLTTYDFAIVPLRNRIFGAVPSKIFELAKLKIPIIFCGGGEGADIIAKFGLGFVSSPGDFAALSNNIKMAANMSPNAYLDLIENCRKVAKDEFDFDRQLAKLEIFVNC